jgi:hypothetical protein
MLCDKWFRSYGLLSIISWGTRQRYTQQARYGFMIFIYFCWNYRLSLKSNNIVIIVRSVIVYLSMHDSNSINSRIWRGAHDRWRVMTKCRHWVVLAFIFTFTSFFSLFNSGRLFVIVRVHVFTLTTLDEIDARLWH